MEIKNSFKIFVIFLIAFCFNACVKDSDFELPPLKGVEPNVKVTKTIGEILSMYKEGEMLSFTEDDVIQGYVVSSDEAGNFYQKIIIQDNFENPTAAVEIRLAGSDLYSIYEIGRKVYVKLKGLGLNDYKGTKQIGVINGNKIDLIPENSNYVLRSLEVENIQPKIVTVSQIVKGEVPIGVLIKLQNMFSTDKGLTYADDRKNTNRNFKSCDGESIILRTSGYADFKSQKISEKTGTLTAVLGVYGTTYQLAIRDTNDVSFISDNCDDSENGGEIDPVTSEIVVSLDEKFDDVVDEKPVSLKGWVVSKVKGSRTWIGDEFNGEKFIKSSGYKYNDGDEIESWVITPGLDLSKATHKNFSFDSQAAYSKDETLNVLISTDFKGDVATATWSSLKVKLADKSSSYSGFVNSGDIDLSSYKGVVYIAFKYLGNGTDKTGTYQIDNVKFNYVSATTTDPVEEPVQGVSKVFISEYAEGSSSNKYIEIYNGSGAPIDLSKYNVELYVNGATSSKSKLNLSGTLADKGVFVIYNGRSNEQIIAQGNLEATVTYFNGDDTIILKKNDTIIDVVGKIGEDPGVAWDVSGVKEATKDHTLVRKASVVQGTTDWNLSSKDQWEVKPIDDFSSLGKR